MLCVVCCISLSDSGYLRPLLVTNVTSSTCLVLYWFHSYPPFPYLFACLHTIFNGGESLVANLVNYLLPTKPSKLVLTINNLLADLLIHQILEKSKFAKFFFHQAFLPYGTYALVFDSDNLSILKSSQQLFIPIGYMRLNRCHYYTYIIIVFSEILHNTTVLMIRTENCPDISDVPRF